MTAKTAPLPVIFRVYRGELLALFPTEQWARTGADITCYARVGQHAPACRSLLRLGRLAAPDEYAGLLVELRGIYERSTGPNDPVIPLKVYKRAPRRH